MQLSEYTATSDIFDRELKLSWESVKAVFIVERTQDLQVKVDGTVKNVLESIISHFGEVLLKLDKQPLCDGTLARGSNNSSL